MRRLVNLIISGFVLLVSSKIFPEQIHIKDFCTLAVASVLLWLTTILISIIAFLIIGSGIIFEGCGWIIFGAIALAGAKILALYALSAWLPGFSIEGFWLKTLVAFACSFFALSSPSSLTDNHENHLSDF